MQRLPVLVIEEDLSLAQYIAGILAAMGYQPLVADSVEAALRSIADRPYALIVADYLGPRDQFLRRWPILNLLARFAPGTPVLALSPLPDLPAPGGVSGILRLPFTGDELERAVKHHALAQPEQPCNPLVARYLAELWVADDGAASGVVAAAMQSGWTAAAVYEDMFATALHEIGKWWGAYSCTVADEHGARAITERLMARIAAEVVREPSKGRNVVVACIPAERHELGARMAADLLDWDGWTVRFLGADTPADETVNEARRRQADMMALSACMPPDWDMLRSQIAAARAAGLRTVILGGQAFLAMDPAGVVALGADAKADRASDGVKLADRLAGDQSPGYRS